MAPAGARPRPASCFSEVGSKEALLEFTEHRGDQGGARHGDRAGGRRGRGGYPRRGRGDGAACRCVRRRTERRPSLPLPKRRHRRRLSHGGGVPTQREQRATEGGDGRGSEGGGALVVRHRHGLRRSLPPARSVTEADLPWVNSGRCQ
jgi:hypothetical protein